MTFHRDSLVVQPCPMWRSVLPGERRSLLVLLKVRQQPLDKICPHDVSGGRCGMSLGDAPGEGVEQAQDLECPDDMRLVVTTCLHALEGEEIFERVILGPVLQEQPGLQAVLHLI